MSKVFFDLLKYSGIALGSFGVFASTSLYNVDAGESAVIFDKIRGVLPYNTTEGTHLKIPFIQKPYVFEIRCQPKEFRTVTGTKDLQNVALTLRVLFKPVPKGLPNIFLNFGYDYEKRILPSISNEILKSIVAQYDASELIVNRDNVSKRIRTELQKRAAHFDIQFDDISLTHIEFSKEFAEAVEAKQIAQQDAERAKFAVEKAKQEKKAAIIKAQGDAQAASLLQNAFTKTGLGLLEFRRLEASEEIVSELSRSSKITFIPKNSSMLLNIPSR
ncbi:MAG: hypothetical protein MHMPM18_002004 [Marteilia pararefringens]